MNMGLLLFLIVFIYAVLGINLFATIKSQAPMNSRLNFQSFANAFMTMIRTCTGEGWNDLMAVLCMGNTPFNLCINDSSYEANAKEPVNCGASKAVTWLFFASYTFLITLVFLNLFIAIILDGYFDASDT